jgi:colicin import membrane protein
MKMNKNVMIGAVLVALAAAGGYYQFSMKPAQEAAQAAQDEAAAQAKAAEEAAAKAADEAAAQAKAAEEAAAATAKAAADAAAQVANDAAAAATDATSAMTDAMAALDPASFDAVKIKAMIDASSLNADLKTTLKANVDAAASNPALVESTVSAVKTALGM